MDKQGEAEAKRKAEWYQLNKELVKERSRKQYWNDPITANKERVNRDRKNPIQSRIRKSRWEKAHSGLRTFKRRIRKGAEAKATPIWCNMVEIDKIYKDCKLNYTNHHVDHIIPLRHHDICGLHVHWNLQIIPAYENIEKSNKFTPYSEYFT
jgi:hypothetical protein